MGFPALKEFVVFHVNKLFRFKKSTAQIYRLLLNLNNPTNKNLKRFYK